MMMMTMMMMMMMAMTVMAMTAAGIVRSFHFLFVT